MPYSSFSLHGCFGDHMVLQRGKPVVVSGSATPDVSVTATFRGVTESAVVPDSGEWRIVFPAGEAGGPFTLHVAADCGTAIDISDVMVGELWLCSGQSNMEYPVSTHGQAFWGLPDGDAVAADGDGMIRLFQTPRMVCPDGPCPEPPARCAWRRGDDPDAVAPFSAVGWFFGKALRRRLGPDVAVGLVNASWGGTKIEPWITRQAYEKAGRDAELAQEIEGIVQIVPAVGTLRHVRRVKVALQIAVFRILILAVDDPFTAPVAQVADRGGPAHIISHAEDVTVEKVMGTVYVYAVAEHVGFPVRDILPGGKVGIEGLLFHSFSVLSRYRSIRKRTSGDAGHSSGAAGPAKAMRTGAFGSSAGQPGSVSPSDPVPFGSPVRIKLHQ